MPANKGVIRVTEWSDGSSRLNYPENGSFDIVVLGAGLPPEIPAPETILKGKPIYTTYIQVGTGRDWILQYCADQPLETATKRSGMVINLGAEQKLEAPYIQLAVFPARVVEDGKYLAYHFRITVEGRLRDVRQVAGSLAKMRTLASQLGDWRFRPAKRGQSAVPLEAVLLVPPGRVGE